MFNRARMFTLGLFAALSYSASGESWVQLDNSITADTLSSNFGLTVSMSADASRMAIGANRNDELANDAGKTVVYERTETGWVQLGQDIFGEAADDRSGLAVSLSRDGNTVAIGAPFSDETDTNSGHVRVYRWSGSDWVKLGADIGGETSHDSFGDELSLNSDGTVLAVGAENANFGGGQVRVYRWNGSSWTQRGADIDSDTTYERLGDAVSISSDGNRIVVGAPGYASSPSNSASPKGRIFIYDWNGSSWVQVGNTIYGQSGGDGLGKPVSISLDGKRFAASGTGLNLTSVFEYDGTSWVKLGSDFSGGASSISLNDDGSFIAIGEHSYSVSDATWNIGRVRIFEYISSSWIQRGGDILGESSFDYFGISVSLSSEGFEAAIGALSSFQSPERTDQGYAKAFELQQPPEAPIFDIPIYVEIDEGSTATVDATAIGGYPRDFTYQWYYETVAVPSSLGGTSPIYDIEGIADNKGTWRVTVTNSTGSTTDELEFMLTKDTDGDGLTDGQEIYELPTNPNLADTDGDGLNDGDEVNTYGTDPIDIDTDNDTIADGIEVDCAAFGFDPLVDSSSELSAFQKAAAKLPGVLTDEQNDQLSLGGVSITPTGESSFSVVFVIEESSDLPNWNTVDTISHTLDGSGSKKFIRVRKLD